MAEKQEFFGQLYEDNREILLRTASIYLRTEEDAEDMVQDTFSRALPRDMTDSETEILRMRYEQSMDYREISRRLRAPEGACRVKVLRARKKYKKFLEENL